VGAVALQREVYRPRNAEHTVLHQVVAEHLETFLGAVAEPPQLDLSGRLTYTRCPGESPPS